MIVADEIQMKVRPIYAPALTSQARYILLYGGRSGGRSHFGVQRYISLMRDGTKYFRGYFIREVLSDIRESLWRDFTDQITDLKIKEEFRLDDGKMKATHILTGNTIISKGVRKSSGNQTAKLKSIAGATHVLIEEADEVGERDFDKLDDSLRTVKVENCQVMMLFNPEDENSWINSRWFTNNEPNRNDPELLAIRATYKDNLRYTSPSTVAKLESYKERDPEYYKVFTLGQWGGGAKGRIYENWSPIEEWVDITDSIYGLDFGFTNDPACLVEIQKHNNKIYGREMIFETGLTNQDLAKRIKELGIKGTIYADSAEPKSIEEIRREKIDIKPCVKGADSVRSGISFLKDHEVFITKSSKNIWHEIKYYIWQTDRDGKPTNKPRDLHNHSMDAIRYAVHTHFYIRKRRRNRALTA